MTYLLYARVSPKGSTWAGGETTIPDQLAAMRAYVLAREPGATIIEATDLLLSGHTVAKRPTFRRIAADLAAKTAKWDAFCVWRLDRAFRSVADAAPFFRQLRDQNKGFVSCTENLDLASPAGRAMLGMLCVFAEFEHDSTSQRVLLKMRGVCEAGGWPVGNAPFGYRRPGKHNNILEPDPDTAPTVQAIFRAFLSGQGAAELVRTYKLHRTTLWWILKNPIYHGIIRYGGQDYMGKHTPLIAKATFDAVQSKLPGSRRAPRPGAQKYPYILAGLLQCHCGRAMSPYSATNRKGTRYAYYTCTDAPVCNGRVSAKEIETKVVDAIAGLQYTPNDIQHIIKTIHRQRDRDRRKSTPEIQRLHDRLEKLRKELAKIDAVFLSDRWDASKKDYWNERLGTTRQEILNAEARISYLSERHDSPTSEYALMEAIALGLPNLSRIIAANRESPDQLRVILAMHIDKVIRLESKDAWRLELKTGEKLDWSLGMVGQPVIGLTLFIEGERVRLVVKAVSGG